MLVFKIFRAPEWEAFQSTGRSEGAPVDLTDGYIHLSTAGQVRETAAKHFAGEDGLVLLALEAAQLGPELRWEKSRSGQDFPHLYRPLDATDILWCKPLPLTGGQHVFPPDLKD
ncbi:MAG: hypothetical protein CR993_08365 [Rhodobacterales bacterium]|nr:MAG: hypothetical protein CR993_08365 [Rhodobacterales bacterium]